MTNVNQIFNNYVKEDCTGRAQINSNLEGFSTFAKVPETKNLYLVRDEEDVFLYEGKPSLVIKGDVEHYPFIDTTGCKYLGSFFDWKYPKE